MILKADSKIVWQNSVRLQDNQSTCFNVMKSVKEII